MLCWFPICTNYRCEYYPPSRHTEMIYYQFWMLMLLAWSHNLTLIDHNLSCSFPIFISSLCLLSLTGNLEQVRWTYSNVFSVVCVFHFSSSLLDSTPLHDKIYFVLFEWMNESLSQVFSYTDHQDAVNSKLKNSSVHWSPQRKVQMFK